MAKLRVENLIKNYGSLRCLDGIDLEVGDGELVVIVGPSGCGKTTLMRCVVGLETFSEGSIYIDDELINDRAPKDRDVAMVFQYYALYPHMTVNQNLSLGLEHTTNLSKVEIRKRVEAIAEVLHISNLLKRKPAQLSGGESQRVAIGRALVRKPKIFLLDEPLSAIDAKLKRELRTEIRRIQREFGITTLYVTHDQEEAMAVADRLVVLRHGKIHQIGSPEEVFNNPQDQFVARFIGKPPMNFFELEARDREGVFFVENEEFSSEISPSLFENYLQQYLQKKIVVGLRPSAIQIIAQKSDNRENDRNTAIVSLIENFGEENHIYLNLAQSGKMIVKSSSDLILEIGDSVHFTFTENDLHFFDKESTQSLISEVRQ
jgi:multiple sugar transport system ATP-binding protein